MRAICLTLDKRLDYFNEYIKPEFKKRLGIDVERFLVGDGSLDEHYDYIDDPLAIPMRFEKSTNYATWYSPPAYNAYRSHHAIFTRFLESGEPRFLLLEDDVFIEDDFEQIVGDDLDELAELRFDMLQLGSYGATKKGQAQSSNMLLLPRLSGVGGFHAVILNRRVVKRLLEIPPYSPFDEIAAKYIHGNLFECLAVTPSVITQKNGYSYVEQSYLEKPNREV